MSDTTAQSSKATTTDQSFKQITEEMYKRNAELAIRNKTLSVLRRLYVISMASLDVVEVAQKIVDAVMEELGFKVAIISLVESQVNLLRPIAITHTPEIDEALKQLGKPIQDYTVPLDFVSNLAVEALEKRRSEITGNLMDFFVPHLAQEQADLLENIIGINTLIGYPILMGKKQIGVFIIGLDKTVDDLSRTQRETLEQLLNLISLALDRAKLHEKLRLANEKLREVDKLKDEFLSLASHELRTPMASIKGFLYLILKNKQSLPPGVGEKLARVYNSSERMIALVNDMLDVSRIEAGRLEIIPGNVDIVQAAHEVKDELLTLISQKQITIIVPSEVHFIAYVDPNKLHQVLMNFISNAVKFTPEQGSIAVTFEEKSDFIVTCVKDSGIGIKEEDLQKLFGKFIRIDTKDTSLPQTQGTGLGLYITKKIIELSGGTIMVESTIGKGTTFSFSLPKPNLTDGEKFGVMRR